MTLIVVPWRDDGYRARVCQYVCDRLRSMLPGVAIFLADSNHETFNRAASRNLGVATASPDEIVVVCDADTIPDPYGLGYAIDGAQHGGLHYPFAVVNYLTEAGTEFVLAGREPDPTRIEFSLPSAHGGCMVMLAREWQRAGGMDERFTAWGFEDNAWWATVRDRLGMPMHHPGVAWHLWHPADRYAGTLDQTRNWLMARRALGT